MWTSVIIITSLTIACFAEITAPGFDRSVSDGVKSIGYKVVYGDADLTIVNEVVSSVEKNALKDKSIVNDIVKPLEAQDVKCLMSVDRYCSKEMGQIKNVLIQAIKEDCVKCSVQQKESAGQVIAAMMAHDPVAWKLFLTRSALQIMPRKEVSEQEEYHLKLIGEPEELISSPKSRYMKPGFKVRVKRYQSERIL